MKKAIYLLFASLLYSIYTEAQTNTWSELGGLDSLGSLSTINIICSDPAGNIYAGGQFENAQGHQYVARYNGTSWTELGGPNSLQANNFIYSLCSDPSGNIYASGNFTNAQGQRYVAEYDGTSWVELSGLNLNSSISRMVCDAAGNLYVSGNFTDSVGLYNVMKYDGSAWTKLGQTPLNANGSIDIIAIDLHGNIYAGGDFRDSLNNAYVARYDGNTWSQLGGAGADFNNGFSALYCDASGDVYIGGSFKNASGKLYVAKYDGTTWSELGGINALHNTDTLHGYFINSITGDVNGSIYVSMQRAPGTTGGHCLYEYSGAWSIEDGFDTLPSHRTNIFRLCNDPSGNVYAAGFFTNKDSYTYVAKKTVQPNGIKDISESFISIKPNPTNRYATIALEHAATDAYVSVTDISGQTVIEMHHQSGSFITLDISALSTGLYVVKVQQDGNILTGKVVKAAE